MVSYIVDIIRDTLTEEIKKAVNWGWQKLLLLEFKWLEWEIEFVLIFVASWDLVKVFWYF